VEYFILANTRLAIDKTKLVDLTQ